MRIRTIVALAAVGILGALPASAVAQATGEVGGAPTMGAPLPFPPPHKKTFLPKATSEAIVIGVGFGPFGKVEIVAQDTNKGLCIDIDQIGRDSSSGTCGRVVLPSSIAIQSETFEIDSKNGRRSLSEVAGFMQPSAASVIAIASRRKGGRRTRKAVSGIVAVPDSDLLARLHQKPFGFFVADFRGCLADAKMRVKAFDPVGVLLGSSVMPRPKKLFPRFRTCVPGTSTVGFVIGGAARTALAR
jgi:hypothetical protein